MHVHNYEFDWAIRYQKKVKDNEETHHNYPKQENDGTVVKVRQHVRNYIQVRIGDET